MTDAPDWYTRAISRQPELGEREVAGARIASRAWQSEADAAADSVEEGIILVHGGAAHARWWDHIAPLLTARHRVVALDLSGHGDSDHRSAYHLDLWAEEVLAVADEFATPPTLVGHSMGGMVSIRAASIAPERLNGAIIVDTPVSVPTPEDSAASDKLAFGPKRRYATREQLVARFRPIPQQPTLDYIEHYVAEHSVREEGGEWMWKFDPLIFARAALPPSFLARLDCRVAFFRGENGMVDRAMEEVIYDGLGRVAPVIEIPEAGHHIMLDQPLALVTGIRTLLGEWEHSQPLA
jgi:pimeloyl-ACP methyl ester carboxylesterase